MATQFSGSGSGGGPNRFVIFSEVMFDPYAWDRFDPPDKEGFVTYSHQSGHPSSTIKITRSDGKVLSFEVSGDYSVQIRENVIRFFGTAGEPSGGHFH